MHVPVAHGDDGAGRADEPRPAKHNPNVTPAHSFQAAIKLRRDVASVAFPWTQGSRELLRPLVGLYQNLQLTIRQELRKPACGSDNHPWPLPICNCDVTTVRCPGRSRIVLLRFSDCGMSIEEKITIDLAILALTGRAGSANEIRQALHTAAQLQQHERIPPLLARE